MLTTYATTTNQGVIFDIVPETLAGAPAQLGGAVLHVANANPELFTAVLTDDGKLKVTPTGTAGVGSVQVTSAPGGVFTAGGTITITLTAPLPLAQTFDYTVDSTFTV